MHHHRPKEKLFAFIPKPTPANAVLVALSLTSLAKITQSRTKVSLLSQMSLSLICEMVQTLETPQHLPTKSCTSQVTLWTPLSCSGEFLIICHDHKYGSDVIRAQGQTPQQPQMQLPSERPQ
jgi:hypothetical protein